MQVTDLIEKQQTAPIWMSDAKVSLLSTPYMYSYNCTYIFLLYLLRVGSIDLADLMLSQIDSST